MFQIAVEESRNDDQIPHGNDPDNLKKNIRTQRN